MSRWSFVLPVFLFATLLVATVAPMMAQVSTPSTPDPPRAELVLEDVVRAEGAQAPKWVHGVATNTTLEVTIKNAHEWRPVAGYELEFLWEPKGGEATWLNGDRMSSMDVGKDSLGPGESHTHDRIHWQLQSEHRGDGNLVVLIRPEGSTQEETEFWELPVLVQEMEFGVEQGDRLIRPHETTFLRATLENKGTQKEVVDLGLVDWQVQPSNRLGDAQQEFELVLEGAGTVEVPPGKKHRMDLYVHYNWSGDEREFSVQFDLRASTGYGHVLNATTPALNNTVDSDLPPGSPVRVDRLDNSPLIANLDTGDPLELEFRLTNIGSSRDVYRIGGLASPGWSVETSPQRAALDPGESIRFRVDLWPPEEAIKGDTGEFSVAITSGRESEPFHQEPLPLRVGGPAVRVDPASGWSDHAYVGDPAQVQIRLTNQGDEATPSGARVEVTASGPGLDLGPGETDSHSRDMLDEVAPGRSTTVVLEIGDYEAGGPVHFIVEWIPPSGTGNMFTRHLERDVFVHDPGVELVVPSSSLTGSPGEVVGYRSPGNVFVVHNTGNAREQFEVNAATEHGSARVLLAEPRFTLEPGENRSVAVDHRMPLPAGTLTHANVTLEVSILGHPGFQWSGWVSTQIFDDAPPRIIDPSPDIPSLWLHGEPLSLTLRVTDGSGVDSVEVLHKKPDNSTVMYPLSPLEGELWGVEVTPLGKGGHGFTFSARDVRGNMAELAPVFVQVEAIDPPVLDLVEPAEGDTVSPERIFHVGVMDELSLDSVTLRIYNETQEFVLARNVSVQDGVGRFDLNGAPAGNVTFVIEAVNVAGARAEVTRNVVVEIRDDRAPVDLGGSESAPAPALWFFLAVLAGLLLRERRKDRSSMRLRRTGCRKDAGPGPGSMKVNQESMRSMLGLHEGTEPREAALRREAAAPCIRNNRWGEAKTKSGGTRL